MELEELFFNEEIIEKEIGKEDIEHYVIYTYYEHEMEILKKKIKNYTKL